MLKMHLHWLQMRILRSKCKLQYVSIQHGNSQIAHWLYFLNHHKNQPTSPLKMRSLVSLMGAAMALNAAASSAIAASIPLMVEPDLPRFRKTPSGVKIQEVVEGSGLEANNGDLVEFNYVCRRSNGYFVYSTVDQFGGESQPVVLPLGEGKIITGLEEVIVGMKPGGKRRALVPPAVGYVDLSLGPQPQEFGPRRSLISHANEPLVFEVQLLKIKSCSAGDSSKQLC
ncbi:unnamed protein product [Sphagnum jensenii]|uniref:peptidylprolyl isomerase n=1 Tax=Sphagnum jensenii TaxID=128206 RepID=A0ABP1A7G7_9BRYO